MDTCLPDSFNNYGTQTQSINTLLKWKWSSGFDCPACSSQVIVH
jgi:hypothetical protein